MPPEYRMPFAIGLGVIGGLAIGSWAVGHLAVEGTTKEERKNLLLLSAVVLIGYGVPKLLEVDRRWVTIDAWLEEAQKASEAP